MPPDRTLQLRYPLPGKLSENEAQSGINVVPVAVAASDKIVDFANCNLEYPLDDNSRRKFKLKSGKMPSAHQWAVYDFVRKIPVGKVTTYKHISIAIGQGSPRSVGAALRNNPFAPFVPCHRIIASNHYIGGFYGEWGQQSKTGKQYRRKIGMLAKEGVVFNEKGYLVGGDAIVWTG